VGEGENAGEVGDRGVGGTIPAPPGVLPAKVVGTIPARITRCHPRESGDLSLRWCKV